MEKTYLLSDLDCAVCAAKMEDAIKKIDKVRSASVNFLTCKLTVEAESEDFDGIIKVAQKAISKIEPDCKILIK